MYPPIPERTIVHKYGSETLSGLRTGYLLAPHTSVLFAPYWLPTGYLLAPYEPSI